MRVRANSLSQITLRLADSLIVHSVFSQQYGRLFSLRVRNQNTVLVNLPFTLLRDAELTLTVAYSGRLAPQPPERETLAMQGPPQRGNDQQSRMLCLDHRRTQLRTAAAATGIPSHRRPTILPPDRITLPVTLTCVATGEPRGRRSLPPQPARRRGASSEFVARARSTTSRSWPAVGRPTAYGGLRRFGPTEEGRGNARLTSTAPSISGAVCEPDSPSRPTRCRSPAAQLINDAADIARFYDSLIGDAPYDFTLALVEPQPGGHSPAYFAALNQPLPTRPALADRQ
jgi:hypothetical protein